MKLKDWDPTTSFIKAVIKGEPGTRKTTQAATFPGPILWIDTDRKAPESITLPRMKGTIPRDTDITIEQPNNWYGVEKLLRDLESRCDYRTVVLDSLTSSGDKVNRQTLNKDKGGKVIGGIAVNTIEDYNAETSALLYAVDVGKLLPCHFLMIAHVIKRDQATLGGPTKILRQLVTGGKVVGAKIPAYFPEVYHFDFEAAIDSNLPPDFVMYTQSHGDDFARTALPLPFKTNMNGKQLWQLIKAAQEEMIATIKNPNKLITG